MKFITTLTLAAMLPCIAAEAQTATNAPPQVTTPQGFIQSTVGYFTSFDTNSQTFSTNSQYEFWTGAAYQSGVNLGAEVAFEAKPFAKAPGLTLGEVSTFAGVIGTISQEEVDVGWSIDHYDVELTLGAAGVYAFQNDTEAAKGIHGGIYAEVKKALTANTFAGTRLEGVFGSNSGANQLVVSLFAGFTF